MLKLFVACALLTACARPGIFIFDSASPEQVQTWLADDPAIAAGRLSLELATWYGPSGLTYDGKAESLAE